jgi:hypothetical protein
MMWHTYFVIQVRFGAIIGISDDMMRNNKGGKVGSSLKDP